MRLSGMLAGIVGVGACLLVAGFGAVFYSWQSGRFASARQQLEADAWQTFQERYPRHGETIQGLLSEAKKTLDAALNLTLSLSKEGDTLESQGTRARGWHEVLCQSPQISFGCLQRSEQAPVTLVLTGRAAQTAKVLELLGKELKFSFGGNQQIWSAEAVESFPECSAHLISGAKEDAVKGVYRLEKSPPVQGLWINRPSELWPALTRFIAEGAPGIALLDNDGSTAAVLSSSQVVSSFAVEVPKESRVPFVVSTPDRKNTFFCEAALLTEGTNVTWGIDLRTILGRFPERPNRAVFLLEEGVLVPIEMPEPFALLKGQLEAFFLSPSTLVESFGTTTISDTELFFEQFLPVPESLLRVFIVEMPQAPGTTLAISLRENLAAQHQLMAFAAWIGMISTLSLSVLAWVAGRWISAPIRRAAQQINHLLIGHGVGPPPRFHPTLVDEVNTLDESCVALHARMMEKAKLQGLLNAFVAPSIAQRLEEGVVHPGGGRYHAAILFADVRGFTKSSLDMRADEVIIFLNSCFEAICPPIEANGGVIDKFIGDAVMAIFGAPNPFPDVEQKALQAALEMRAALHEFNRKRVLRTLPPINMGWGIASGEVTAGVVGSLHRSNFTALGTVVNRASRLCDAAISFEILMDSVTFAASDTSEGSYSEKSIVLHGLGQETVFSIPDETKIRLLD